MLVWNSSSLRAQHKKTGAIHPMPECYEDICDYLFNCNHNDASSNVNPGGSGIEDIAQWRGRQAGRGLAWCGLGLTSRQWACLSVVLPLLPLQRHYLAEGFWESDSMALEALLSVWTGVRKATPHTWELACNVLALGGHSWFLLVSDVGAFPLKNIVMSQTTSAAVVTLTFLGFNKLQKKSLEKNLRPFFPLLLCSRTMMQASDPKHRWSKFALPPHRKHSHFLLTD